MRRFLAALWILPAVVLIAGLERVSGGYVPPKVYQPPAMDISALMRVALIKDQTRLPQGWPPNVLANAKAVKTISYRQPTIKKPGTKKQRKAKRRVRR